jgi:hypothetical protein
MRIFSCLGPDTPRILSKQLQRLPAPQNGESEMVLAVDLNVNDQAAV